MSALHNSFARADVSVIALYMTTCGGVHDHAAEPARQVEKHRIDYPVLDVEANGGTLADPTRKRFPWAPHALVVDKTGQVIRTYGHIPEMESLREDLAELVATGLVPAQPGDGWRDFPRRAWVDRRIEGREPPRTERTTLRHFGANSVTVQRGNQSVKFVRATTDTEKHRVELPSETVTVDGEDVKARVFEAKWKHGDIEFVERSWIARGTLLRRETIETPMNGPSSKRSLRLLKWSDTLIVGKDKIDCRVVETTTTWEGGRTQETVWLSDPVPGHEVQRIHRTTPAGQDGNASVETSSVIAFGLR